MIRWTRESLDDAFPTVVRYAGLAMTVTLIVLSARGLSASALAPGYVAATGMLLYKTVKRAAEDGA